MTSTTQTALLRLALLLIVGVFALFIMSDLLLHIGWLNSLKLPVIASLPALFFAFTLFICLALRAVLWQLLYSLRGYFAKPARIQRRLWFLQTQHSHLQQHFQHRARYIYYVNDLKRQQLLQADYRKQSRLLARAIQNELSRCQSQLDKKTFQTLQKQLNNYRKHYDSAALLALQEKLIALTHRNLTD